MKSGRLRPEGMPVLEDSLNSIAEKIQALDEASLSGLWQKYKDRMERFDASKEWEKAVIILFIINAVRIKNQIFNEQIQNQNPQKELKSNTQKKPDLRRIK